MNANKVNLLYFKEHDVRSRPAPRALLDRGVALPRAHVDEGGRRADAQRAEHLMAENLRFGKVRTFERR